MSGLTQTDRVRNAKILSEALANCAKAKGLITDSTLDATTIGTLRMLIWDMETEIKKLQTDEDNTP